MSKSSSPGLTSPGETEAAPMLPPGGMPSMPFWVVAREGRQIVCRPHALTGTVRGNAGPWVPPELLARMVPILGDTEDSICR